MTRLLLDSGALASENRQDDAGEGVMACASATLVLSESGNRDVFELGQTGICCNLKCMGRGRVLVAALGAILLAGCATVPSPARMVSDKPAVIEAELARHIAVLASNDFEGRKPGTIGETKTLDYLTRQWQALGLDGGTNNPANPWLAPVDIVLSKPATSKLRFFRNRKLVPLPDNSAVAFASGQRALLERAPLLFVGKQGPELDSAELSGRVAVMLWDHPGQIDQREALLDKGASAVLVLVNTEKEWAEIVVRRDRGTYHLASDVDGSLLDGFLSPAAADAIIGAERLKRLRTWADEPDFKPVQVRIDVSIEATSTADAIKSHNVISRLPGKSPGSGAVLLLAHWDHFGICAPPGAADRICNGAVDNASGLAVLTEIARRLAAGPKLDRDVYFLATTGEEWGLLGARAFTADPPLPLTSIVAGFNFDSVAVAKRGAPVAIVGEGLTRLDPMVEAIIKQHGRVIGDEPFAEGFVKRQDGWVLLQRDVPTLMVSSAFGARGPLDRYTKAHYHQPSDEAATVELGGAAEDISLQIGLVRYFGDISTYPAGETSVESGGSG